MIFIFPLAIVLQFSAASVFAAAWLAFTMAIPAIRHRTDIRYGCAFAFIFIPSIIWNDIFLMGPFCVSDIIAIGLCTKLLHRLFLQTKQNERSKRQNAEIALFWKKRLQGTKKADTNNVVMKGEAEG